MSDKDSFLQKIFEWAKQPKNYSWLVPLLALIILFFTVRSCFGKKETFTSDYTIARDATWSPLNFYGKERNVLGFSDDLIFEVAKLKKLRIRLVSSSPHDLLGTLQGPGNVDGIFSSLNPDVTLQDHYYFSDPYFDLGTVLVVEESSSINSLADMEGKFLGIKRGSAILFNIPNRPNVSIFPYDSMIVMMDDLIKDRIDGALMNRLNAYNLTSAYYRGRLRIATPPLTYEGLRLITRPTPKNKKLIDDFNDALKQFKENGTYLRLVQKWDLVVAPSEPLNETNGVEL